MFCLIKEEATKLKQAISDGRISPEKLATLSSEEARNLLATVLSPENAKQVNLLYEKKLLLKNQEKAVFDMFRDVTGLSKADKEAAVAKLRATLAEKGRRIFNPTDKEKILAEVADDIYSRKFKTDISLEEVADITNLSNVVDKLKAKMTPDFKWPTKEAGLEYGAAQVAFDKYVGGLVEGAKRVPLPSIVKAEGVAGKSQALVDYAKRSINFIAENSRSLVASIDNSMWGNQGIKTLFNPRTSKIWAENFAKSFEDIAKTIKGGVKKGDAILDAVNADKLSRENYLNGRYTMGKKLALGGREEAFPTSYPSKIPVLGRFFKASEVSYESGALRLRMDIADQFYALAEKMGVDMTDKLEVGSINEMVNMLTGRADLFGGTADEALNKVFFAPKFFKSNLDFLLAVPKGAVGTLTGKATFAQKQAAINVLSVLATTAVILATAKKLNPESVDFDPRSSDFGKIKIGNSRVALMPGYGTIITLISRLITNQTKSTSTGKVTTLGEAYGSPTAMDVFWSFTEGKFSPLFSALKQLREGKDFTGKPVGPLDVAKGIVTPMSVSAIMDSKKYSDTDPLVDVLLNALNLVGFNLNTYQMTAKNEAIKMYKAGDMAKAETAMARFNQDLIQSEIDKIKTEGGTITDEGALREYLIDKLKGRFMTPANIGKLSE